MRDPARQARDTADILQGGEPSHKGKCRTLTEAYEEDPFRIPSVVDFRQDYLFNIPDRLCDIGFVKLDGIRR